MTVTEYEKTRSELSLQIRREMLNLCLGSIRVLPLFSTMHDKVYAGSASDPVYQEDNMTLFHYHPVTKRLHRTPVLIIYALVNRPYILDIETRSVVRNLLNQGFDIYIIDWGIPNTKERWLTIKDYVNGYIDRCVDVVKKFSNSERVTLFGYCMGGTLSVIYAALHKNNVKNLVTVAAPFDCSKDSTVFGSIARFLDVDTFVDGVGNVPAIFQHMFFMMLNPFKHHVGRYNEVADRIEDKEFVDDFIRLERWLCDTPPIPGELFRQWVKEIYEQNLLAQNRLQIGEEVVDLSEIDVPLLNIIAESDNLVAPESSKALNYLVSSKDKTLMLFPTGHIGLLVSSYSQTQVWPRVGDWLKERS